MSQPVRPLTSADYRQARHVFEALPAGQTLPDSAEGRTAFERILSHPGTVIFGAVAGRRIVSIATLHILPNMTYQARPYALIENVATLPSHAGRGYGKAVMQAAIKAAQTADAYKVMLLTGRANAATGFYEKLGFSSDEKHGMVLRLAA